MKFLHLADLHLGKTLHNRSLIEGGDQQYLIEQLLELAVKERPDAVLISGDVYDRGVPAKEAVPLLSSLLTGFARDLKIPVLMVAGNHDGGERLSFASELLADSNVHIAGILDRELTHISLSDDIGPVDVWLMPYLFPASVRNALGMTSEEIPDYETAVRKLLEAQNIDTSRRNVLVAHQYVVDGSNKPSESDSESCGGVGAIDFTAFDGFDYVALGHIHGAQSIGRSAVRYAGAPMCYHFSEIGQKKGALIVTLGEKGTEPELRTEELKYLHPLRNITGKFADILEQEKYTAGGEYVVVTLTDDNTVKDANAVLSALFQSKNSLLLHMEYRPENAGGKVSRGDIDITTEERSMDQLFADFYSDRRKRNLDDKQEQLIRELSEKITAGAEMDLAQMLVDMALEQEGK